MATKRKNSDFEERYLDQLEGKLNEVHDSVKQNSRITSEGFTRLNGRVTKLENVVLNEHPPPPKISELPPIWNDPLIRRSIYYFTLAILLGVAAWAGADITGLMGD